MLEAYGESQRTLLQSLLETPSGLSVDALASKLAITHNAVRQHLAALERDALVAAGESRPTGGRPHQLYVLTDKARELFPRQYSWFAELLVASIEGDCGPQGLRERLRAMGSSLGRQLLAQHPELRSREEKVRALATLMRDLGYGCDSGQVPVIEANNCPFHKLAMKNPEICEFDRSLLATFTGSKVDHQECMAKGGAVCRFRFKPK